MRLARISQNPRKLAGSNENPLDDAQVVPLADCSTFLIFIFFLAATFILERKLLSWWRWRFRAANSLQTIGAGRREPLFMFHPSFTSLSHEVRPLWIPEPEAMKKFFRGQFRLIFMAVTIFRIGVGVQIRYPPIL